jgi:hypothetical protein
MTPLRTSRWLCAASLLAACSTAPAAETSTTVQPAEPAQGAEAAPTEPAPAAPAAAQAPSLPALEASCVQSIDPAADLALDCLLAAEEWPDVLETMSTLWQTQVTAKFSMLPAEATGPVIEALRTHASTEALYGGMRARLAPQTAELDLPGTFAWYRSPLGQKYLAALTGEEPNEETVAVWQKASKLKPRRKKALETLAKNTDVEGHARAVFIKPMLAMMRAAATEEERVRFDSPEFQAEFEPAVEALAKNMVDISAYLLRDFSDQELATLNARLAEPAARKTSQSLLAAVEATLSEAAAPAGPPFRKATEQLIAMLQSGEGDEGEEGEAASSDD